MTITRRMSDAETKRAHGCASEIVDVLHRHGCADNFADLGGVLALVAYSAISLAPPDRTREAYLAIVTAIRMNCESDGILPKAD